MRIHKIIYNEFIVNCYALAFSQKRGGVSCTKYRIEKLVKRKRKLKRINKQQEHNVKIVYNGHIYARPKNEKKEENSVIKCKLFAFVILYVLPFVVRLCVCLVSFYHALHYVFK